MAWNGSDNTGSVPVKKPAGVKPAASGSVPKVLLAAAVVAALCAAVVVYFLLRDDGGTVPKAPEKPSSGKIAEVAPAATNRPSKVEKPVKELTLEEKHQAEIRRYEEKYGTNMPPGIKARVYFLKNPPRDKFRIKTDRIRLSPPSVGAPDRELVVRRARHVHAFAAGVRVELRRGLPRGADGEDRHSA